MSEVTVFGNVTVHTPQVTLFIKCH